MHVLAADTDGIESNAGAIVTPSTLARAQTLGDLVVPGPTFTKENDFRALLVL